MEAHESVLCRLRVNGDTRECALTPSTTLLEALRYGLALTGSKQGCDKGDCGACTVLVDGEPVLACITLALACEGREVRTVEGLAEGARPHPLQDAFDITGGAQCGFCTPGILMSAFALLAHNPQPSRDEIALALSGNLCRCTGYTKILDAVEMAAHALRERAGAGRLGLLTGLLTGAPPRRPPPHPSRTWPSRKAARCRDPPGSCRRRGRVDAAGHRTATRST